MNFEAQSHDTLAIIHEQFTRIKLLTSDLHIKDQTIGILSDKLQQMEQEIEQSNRTREQLGQQFTMFQEEHNAMFEIQGKKTKSLQLFNQQILAALKEVQDKNQSLLERLKAQEIEIEQQQSGKLEIHQQLNQLREGVSEIEKDLQTTQKKNVQMKKEKAELQDQLRSSSSQLEDIVSRDDQVKNFIVSCEQENQLMRQEILDKQKIQELQSTELAELRFFKKSYEEISKKYEEVVQNFSLSKLANKKSEEVYIEKLDQLKALNIELEKQCYLADKDKKQMIIQLQKLDKKFVTQGQFISDQHKLLNQNLFIFKDVLSNSRINRPSTPTSVHDRLYENSQIKGRKQILRRNESSLRQSQQSKQSTDDQVVTDEQIQEFFNDLETFVNELQERERQNTTSIVSLKSQINDLLIGSEQLRMQLDDLNNANYAWKQESEMRHAQQNECLEAEIQEGWTLYEQESEKTQKLQIQSDQTKEILHQQEQEISQLNLQCDTLRQNYENLNLEFDSLKQVFRQVQDDIEEILSKKSLTQNKLCLAYGFAQQLFKIMLNSQTSGSQYKEMAKLANYTYYFASLKAQLDQPQRHKRQHIYNRFRKVKNAIKFIRYLKQVKDHKARSRNKDLQRLLLMNNDMEITFCQSDQLDQLVEQYLPYFQQTSSNEQEQLMIDHKLSQELYQELIRCLYQKQYDKQQQPTRDGIYGIIQSTQRDLKVVNKLISQEQYYEQQLGDLSKRVNQLDDYIKALQDELVKASMIEKQLVRDNCNLRDQLKTNTPQVSTYLDNQPLSSYSPINSRINNQLAQEPLTKSNALQQELVDILSRKSAVGYNHTQSRGTFNSDKKLIGKIVKQQ